MKKLILAVFASLALFVAAPTFTEASTENLNFQAVAYKAETGDKYYSLDFFDYLFALDRIDTTKSVVTHLQLTNGNYYTFFDYLFGISGSASFQEGLNNLVADFDAQTLNIEAGKVANNGTIIASSAQDNTVAPEPEVREFKVIDIK